MAAAPFGGRWEGWAERRADARSVMCVTVSTPTDAPRGRASTSSGQAPVLSATPGARGGRGPACDRPPGTVRVTPATLTGTSLTDGSNAPSPGSVGFLSRGGLPPFGLLEAAKAASARWVASRASAPAFARIAALRILDRAARSARRAAGLPPSTGRRDGRRAVRQEPRSIRSRRPQGRRPHEPSMRRNEGRVAWRRGRAGGKGMAERERREIAAVRAGR